MNKLPTCCEFHSSDCAQGNLCPARTPRRVWPSTLAWVAVMLIFPPLAALCVRLAERLFN